jgi:hypothetical protein
MTSLCRVTLEKGMKIEILPGGEGLTRFTDLRLIRLVDPAYFEKPLP